MVSDQSPHAFLQEQAERYGARFDQGAKALIEDYVAAANERPPPFLEREIEKIALLPGTARSGPLMMYGRCFPSCPKYRTSP